MADTSFKDYVVDQLAIFGGVSARAMFGGFGIYKAGVMFGLIASDELFFKVDEVNRPDYEARKSQPFVYDGKNKPISMSYWRVPDDVLENPDDLKEWAMKAYDAALKKRSASSVAKPRRRFRALVRRKRR
ncbi:MAG: TfoX/Sxy family protein [Rhodospirillaceae bacterium]|nr:TfoX/Sxy family protein [Rhodospirillaceae bacterium]